MHPISELIERIKNLDVDNQQSLLDFANFCFQFQKKLDENYMLTLINICRTTRGKEALAETNEIGADERTEAQLFLLMHYFLKNPNKKDTISSEQLDLILKKTFEALETVMQANIKDHKKLEQYNKEEMHVFMIINFLKPIVTSDVKYQASDEKIFNAIDSFQAANEYAELLDQERKFGLSHLILRKNALTTLIDALKKQSEYIIPSHENRSAHKELKKSLNKMDFSKLNRLEKLHIALLRFSPNEKDRKVHRLLSRKIAEDSLIKKATAIAANKKKPPNEKEAATAILTILKELKENGAVVNLIAAAKIACERYQSTEHNSTSDIYKESILKLCIFYIRQKVREGISPSENKSILNSFRRRSSSENRSSDKLPPSSKSSSRRLNQ